ncbi:MAG: hypothetical protein QOJ99_619 [Bryobacterales bacterium]|nr:hypothetical protein [Bryobacterales bacterium]
MKELPESKSRTPAPRPAPPPVYRPQIAPVIYPKPAPNRSTAPPVYRPQPPVLTKPAPIAPVMQRRVSSFTETRPAPPVYDPYRSIQQKPFAGPSIIQPSRKRGTPVPLSMLGFKVEHAAPTVVKKDWKKETTREAWWSALGYEPKEGDVSCRIARLGNSLHATIVKKEVPSFIDPTDTAAKIAATLLGPSFHVTVETNTGNSGAHYFYKDGPSPTLQSATYAHRLSGAEDACFAEYQGAVSTVERLLAS